MSVDINNKSEEFYKILEKKKSENKVILYRGREIINIVYKYERTFSENPIKDSVYHSKISIKEFSSYTIYITSYGATHSYQMKTLNPDLFTFRDPIEK